MCYQLSGEKRHNPWPLENTYFPYLKKIQKRLNFNLIGCVNGLKVNSTENKIDKSDSNFGQDSYGSCCADILGKGWNSLLSATGKTELKIFQPDPFPKTWPNIGFLGSVEGLLGLAENISTLSLEGNLEYLMGVGLAIWTPPPKKKKINCDWNCSCITWNGYSSMCHNESVQVLKK